MKNIFLAALFFLFCSPLAYAAGGTCPSGANYTNPASPQGALVTLSSLGITSCYYVAANGSDSNDGLSEASGHPWVHAPFMGGCSSNCATFQNSLNGGGAGGGYAIILRGGDTWNLGVANATWELNQYPGPFVEGTSSNPFYIGVDISWYSGGSWARPIITGGNALCGSGHVGSGCTSNPSSSCSSGPASACTGFYYVASCTYQMGSSNNLIDLSGLKYIILDNLELTGLCQNQLVQSNGQEVQGNNTYVRYGGLVGPAYFTNLYIHGSSHLQFAAPNGSTGCVQGVVCTDIFAFQGGYSTGTVGETIVNSVADFGDSDPVGQGMCFGGFYNVAYNVFYSSSQCIPGTLHIFHDNDYSYFYENGHSNLIESNDPYGTNAIYNNVFRHIETGITSGGGVFLWFGPGPGDTDYIFNNVAYDVGALEYLNNGGVAVTTIEGNYVWFNNTWQSNANQPILRCAGYTNGTIKDTNNHYITDDGTYILGPCSTLTSTTASLMTNATASSDGYTSSQTYAYSPISSISPTVGMGTNNQSYCTTLNTAAMSDATLSDAVTACQYDTRYACTYITVTHTVSCPARTRVVRPSPTAWDIGAYEFVPSGTGNPTSITVTPANPTISVGGQQQFHALDQNNNDITTESFWQSSNPNVAPIVSSGSSIGLATGNSAGTTTISASWSLVSPPSSLTFSITSGGFGTVIAASNYIASGQSVTVPISVPSGYAIHVFVHQGANNTSPFTIISSTAQTFYTKGNVTSPTAAGNTTLQGTFDTSAVFYAANSPSITSVTCSTSAPASQFGCIVMAVPGAVSSSLTLVDGSVIQNGTTSSVTSLNTGALSTSHAIDILFGCVYSGQDSTSFNFGSGFTIPSGGQETRGACAYKTVSVIQANFVLNTGWSPNSTPASNSLTAFQ